MEANGKIVFRRSGHCWHSGDLERKDLGEGRGRRGAKLDQRVISHCTPFPSPRPVSAESPRTATCLPQ